MAEPGSTKEIGRTRGGKPRSQVTLVNPKADAALQDFVDKLAPENPVLGESRAQLREQLREDLKAALTKNGITTPGADELLDLRLIATDPELKAAAADLEGVIVASQAASPKEVAPMLGYLSKTAGCYARDGSEGPPPSAMTLALSNFRRELPEMIRQLTGQTEELDRDPTGFVEALKNLTLSNEAVWEREHARPQVPAPLLIKAPYLALCGGLDTLFDGRPIARFWFLETVARIPYFGYQTCLFLYESMGWWRRSADLKKVHFKEEWNEFHHLLVMESLGGDQAWFDRFIGQHSALAYYAGMTVLWVISPTLAYNFSELIEAHAVDTYGEFVDANAEKLRALPPPEIAVAYYGDDVHNLYDVFSRIRDDEAMHVDSMKDCQDPIVRGRARIVEFASIATAAAIVATTALTVETVDVVESAAAPVVAKVEERAEEKLQAAVEKEEGLFKKTLREAETGTVQYDAQQGKFVWQKGNGVFPEPE